MVKKDRSALLQELVLGKESCTGISGEKAHKILDLMLLTRFVDEKMGKMVRQNKGGTFHLGVAGHEMIGVLSALSLEPGKDWAFPYYRDRAFAIGLGCCLVEILGALLAREMAHHSGGRMMPDHFSQKNLRIACQSSCVGSQFLQAAGVAKGIALQGKEEVVYVSGGDGSTSQGDFHEMLNFASIHRLPLVCVIQDNGWAISVSKKEQTAGGSIAKMARGYEGLSVFLCDGCDAEQTHRALQQAVAGARSGRGPSLVVAEVPRIAAHSSSDDPQKYLSKDYIETLKLQDPVTNFSEWMLEKGFLSLQELQEKEKKLFQQVERAASLAEQMPFPKKEDAEKNVFVPFSVEEKEETGEGEPIVLMDALQHALAEEMERDPGVLVFGQDVAKGKGGVFGISRGLTDRFGENRCFNTPLAESTIVGLAIGLSLNGFHKPVAEIQFVDYSWTGMNQICNELASFSYRSNGHWNCPVVLRMPYGGYIQGGPYHSQSLEAFFAHCPGLKIAIPSNASDAKRLLKSAIRDPNPVLFFEHKALYRQRLFAARQESSSDALLPFGKGKVVKEGSDVTCVAWGMTVLFAVQAAEALAKEGISVEVLDLRTIVPWDLPLVLESVKKTGKVLIAHEAPLSCGFGAEIAARLAKEAFPFLDAPIERVGAKNCPVPYAKNLEEAVLPLMEDVRDALFSLARF